MATSRQGSVILYLILIFGFIMGYLYNTQADPTAAVPELDNRFQLTSLKSLEGARIDQTVFSSNQYKSLRIFGSLPVVPEGGGKDNPFE